MFIHLAVCNLCARKRTPGAAIFFAPALRSHCAWNRLGCHLVAIYECLDMHRLSLAGRGGSRGQLHATARVDPLLPVVSGRFPALPHAQKDTRRATETRAGTRRPRRGL